MRRSQELAAARTPFVTATVVRAQSPTSVKPGSVALVLGDGTIEGFVGGTCSEQSVRAYSQVALSTGEPVLLRILPDGPQGGEPEEAIAEEGAVTVRNPCLSGGAIEIFLEPAPPAPRVLVVGDTPIAAALSRIGAELELEMLAVTADGPEPQEGDLAVIVAAHGRDELHWLRRALEAGVPYVGLVASVRRGAGVLADLRADGVPGSSLERIDIPAGIAIGSETAGGDRSLDPRQAGGGSPGLDPGAGRRAAGAGAVGEPRGRSGLRDDRRRAGGNAVARARRRDLLLLLRGLQGEVRGGERACLRRRLT